MVYTLRVSVEDIFPPIERLLAVPGSLTLLELHRVLQLCFGWEDGQSHEFVFDGSEEDESLTLAQALGTEVPSYILYNYDFEEGWQVGIVLEHVDPAASQGPPRCLEGSRAGPKEGSGGVQGYYELLDVLADPDQEMHQMMKQWAGRWSPESFSVARLNRKLERAFPPPLRPGPLGSIGGYRADRLNLRQQMVAALLERGEPMTLEQIAERLDRAGVVLPQGLTSLRRAWRRQPPMREQSGGKLELETDHPEFRLTLTWMQEALERETSPARAKARPEPVTLELLERAMPHGLSHKLTLRRFLTLLLDLVGGQARLDELAERATAMGWKVSPDDILRSIRGRPQVFLREGEMVTLERGPGDLDKARKAFTSWWTSQGARAAELEDLDERMARRREEAARRRDQTRDWFRSASREVVRWIAAGDGLAAACMQLPQQRTSFFGPGETEQLRARLRGTDVVIGLDPKALFELLGLDARLTRFIDITPPFSSFGSGRQRHKVSLDEALAMTVPVEDPLGSEQRMRDWLTTDCLEPLADRLARDVRVLHAYYRYGVQQRAVRRRAQGWEDFVPVQWNLGYETPLEAALDYALMTRSSLMLSVDPANPLTAEEWLRPFQPVELCEELLRGTWLDTKEKATVAVSDIVCYSLEKDVPDDDYHW